MNMFTPEDADKLGDPFARFPVAAVINFTVEKLSHLEFPTKKDKEREKHSPSHSHTDSRWSERNNEVTQ